MDSAHQRHIQGNKFPPPYSNSNSGDTINPPLGDSPAQLQQMMVYTFSMTLQVKSADINPQWMQGPKEN